MNADVQDQMSNCCHFTYQEVKDALAQHLKGDANVPEMVEKVQHADTEAVKQDKNLDFGRVRLT